MPPEHSPLPDFLVPFAFASFGPLLKLNYFLKCYLVNETMTMNVLSHSVDSISIGNESLTVILMKQINDLAISHNLIQDYAESACDTKLSRDS